MGDPLGSPRVASLLFAGGPGESDGTIYFSDGLEITRFCNHFRAIAVEFY